MENKTNKQKQCCQKSNSPPTSLLIYLKHCQEDKEDNEGKKSRSETYSNLRIIFCITQRTFLNFVLFHLHAVLVRQTLLAHSTDGKTTDKRSIATCLRSHHRGIPDMELKAESSSSRSLLLPVMGVISPQDKEEEFWVIDPYKLFSILPLLWQSNNLSGVHTGLYTYSSSCTLITCELFCIHVILLKKKKHMINIIFKSTTKLLSITGFL